MEPSTNVSQPIVDVAPATKPAPAAIAEPPAESAPEQTSVAPAVEAPAPSTSVEPVATTRPKPAVAIVLAVLLFLLLSGLAYLSYHQSN